jgi:peptide/nickel transport system ATP-binding protein
VTFSLVRGKAFALVGESGCGKSTVLRTVCGLNRRYEGKLLWDSEPIPKRRDKQLFKKMQMVFQDTYGSLHPRKTVQSTLTEPLVLHGFDAAQKRVQAVMTAVGLEAEFLFRYPHQLSGGQRQRVAIARCLVIEPEVLLLDEPTSALDVSVQAEILNLLQRLRTERGLSYLKVSHDLAVVAHLCNRIAVMSEGRIIEELTTTALRDGQVVHQYSRNLLEACHE